MTLRGWGILALSALVVGALGWAYLQDQRARAAEAGRVEAIQESSELKGKVNALSQESQAHKALADQAGQTVADQDKTIAALKKRVARSQAPTADPGASAVPEPDRDDPVAVRDQLIEAQDQQIGTLKLEVSELRLALDAQGRALTASEQRARGLEIALDAQRHAAKAGKWVGRFQGFAVGIGVGYVSGRLK